MPADIKLDLFLNVKGILSQKFGLIGDALVYVNLFCMIIITYAISWILWKISRFIFHQVIEKVATKTKTYWDDALVKHRFFRKLAFLVPALYLLAFTPIILEDFQEWEFYVMKALDLLIVVIFLRIISAFIKALEDVLRNKEHLKDKPVASYTQLAQIINYIIFGVIFLSVALNKSPIYFISAMGAMTAILLLVFKDAILGFVASIQIAANDMLRIGDWVSMEKYGADGDVEEINLTTVKVRNWDKTISTIPTYAFIADSFKNWRGMAESDGRRIKRHISIKMSSVKFCDAQMLEKYEKYQLLSEFLKNRKVEIARYNEENNIDTTELINGRRLTNIGVFRRYVEFYLRKHPKLNQDMTLMVRQLAPNEFGLPIEIYAFSKNKEWEIYEGIMADIFDHVLAVVNFFELEVFESPTGDFSILKN